MLLASLAYSALTSRRKRHFQPPSHSRNGARLVSKARYRGRRVYHYSDGEVIAETKRGYKPFESFDDYRYHVDRR
jgi:hypothetical protein